MKSIKTIAALSVTVLLTACGGGGGGGDDAPAPDPAINAEGFWSGTTNNGLEAGVAVLENGETWGVYASGETLSGAIYGNTTVSGNTLSGSGLDLDKRGTSQASYTGNFVAKRSMTIDLPDDVRFTGTYLSEYEQPASLANLAGNFNGNGATAKSSLTNIPVSITSHGTITAGDSFCSIAGTVTPRPSGKNVFDMSITLTGSDCGLSSGTMVKGVAYYDVADRTLLAMGLNSGKNDGFMYLGRK